VTIWVGEGDYLGVKREYLWQLACLRIWATIAELHLVTRNSGFIVFAGVVEPGVIATPTAVKL